MGHYVPMQAELTLQETQRASSIATRKLAKCLTLDEMNTLKAGLRKVPLATSHKESVHLTLFDDES